jgi:hypothetical protein
MFRISPNKYVSGLIDKQNINNKVRDCIVVATKTKREEICILMIT